MLFDSFPKLNLKNRIVMAPMTRCACLIDGSPTPELCDYYVRRAENEVGLIIVESAAVNATHAMGYQNGAQFFNELHHDTWRPVIDRIHDEGAKVWIQLFHAGRLTVPEIAGQAPLAPSAIEPFNGESFWRPVIDGKTTHFQTRTPFIKPQEISVEQIEKVIESFATSCTLAERAGFDGVELHGAHGYLLHQFANDITNQRSDEYEAVNFEFILKLVKACRSEVNSDFILSYRLSLHMVDNTYIRHKKNHLDFASLTELLDNEGVDVFHSSELAVGQPMFGGTMGLCELIRASTVKPIIACGRITDRETAERVLEEGKADLIAIGRPLIVDAELAKSWRDLKHRDVETFSYAEHMERVY